VRFDQSGNNDRAFIRFLRDGDASAFQTRFGVGIGIGSGIRIRIGIDIGVGFGVCSQCQHIFRSNASTLDLARDRRRHRLGRHRAADATARGQ